MSPFAVFTMMTGIIMSCNAKKIVQHFTCKHEPAAGVDHEITVVVGDPEGSIDSRRSTTEQESERCEEANELHFVSTLSCAAATHLITSVRIIVGGPQRDTGHDE